MLDRGGIALSEAEADVFAKLYFQRVSYKDLGMRWGKSPTWARTTAWRLDLPSRPSMQGMPPTPAPMMESILKVTSDAMRVPISVMTTKARHMGPVRARQIAMYVAHRRFGYSMPVIGRAMRRDHTTVLHGVRQVDMMLNGSGKDMQALIDGIVKRVNRSA